jgi:hypothetical protein
MGCASKVLLAGVVAQLGGGGRRILLGEDTGGTVTMLRPITFQCVGAGISSVRPCVCIFVYAYLYVRCVHTHFRLAQIST